MQWSLELRGHDRMRISPPRWSHVAFFRDGRIYGDMILEWTPKVRHEKR